MALILDSLYDALKAAGAPEEQARAATRDVAGYDNRLNRIERDMALLKWMVSFAIAILLGLFWMQWQSLDQLAALEPRVANLETGVARVEDRLVQLESRLTGVEHRLAGIEGSFKTPRSEP
jgi:hypothetical protein